MNKDYREVIREAKTFRRIDSTERQSVNFSGVENYYIGRKYYIVEAKCGHTGTNAYKVVKFAIRANDGREAARICKTIPRVKRNHLDAIRSVTEVSVEEFNLQIEKNKEDPYLHCENIQEQRQLCPNMDLMYEQEDNHDMIWDKKYNRKDKVKYIERREKLKRESHFKYGMSCLD